MDGGGRGSARLQDRLRRGRADKPADRLWRLVESERVSILGLSPTLVRALIPHGDPTADLLLPPGHGHDGRALEPGSLPLALREDRRRALPDHQLLGGTEIARVLPLAHAGDPDKECSLGGPAMGMAMDVVDAEGRSLVDSGEVGELVCKRPFPGMTRGFWRDPERYLDTYWRRFPGVWVHGDWASVDADGYWFLHGRSDDTLNIAGKRIGPAELESAAVAHPAVAEAAAVGVPHEVKGEVAWIFCVASPGFEPSEELAAEVAERAAAELGKAFRPDRVVFVPALPKTRSAKIVRRAVRARALGQTPATSRPSRTPSPWRTLLAPSEYEARPPAAIWTARRTGFRRAPRSTR